MEFAFYLAFAAVAFSLIGFLMGKGVVSLRSSAVIIILLVIASPILLNLFIWFYAGMREEVFTPDVMGLKSETAISKLEESGLYGEISGVSFSNQPEGVVISQRPEGGKKVKEGRVVSLIVSARESFVAVPNLIGLTKDQAGNMLTSLGLNIGQIEEIPSSEAYGTVVAQVPTPAQTVPKGTTVSVSISKGQ